MAVIGAKPKWNDPQQSPEALAKQAVKVPKTYTNPNLPIDALFEGAKTHPWYIEQNPVLRLLSLEAPTQYEELQKAITKGWLVSGFRRINKEHARQFAADCAEHVFPLFELTNPYPTENRHRAIMEILRRLPESRSPQGDLKHAHSMAERLMKSANALPKNAYDSEFKTLWYATDPGEYLAALYGPTYSREYVSHVAQALAHFDPSGPDPNAAAWAARKKEETWQANRLRHYYAMEHPDYKAPESIGAKSKWDDPSIPKEKLSTLRRKNPKTYTNPNITPEELLEGAGKYPWYVEKNPLLGMLSLENPDLYNHIQNNIRKGWLYSGIGALSLPLQRQFELDCATRVLPIIEETYRKDPRPRAALELAKEMDDVPMNYPARKTLDDINAAVKEYREEGSSVSVSRSEKKYHQKWAAYYAAKAIAHALYKQDPTERNVPQAALDAQTHIDREKQEEQWQVDCLRKLYAQEHPEYQEPEIVGAMAPLVTQCILVDKKTVPTLSAAIALVEKLRYSVAYVTETPGNWRFQQQSPGLFVRESFITRPVATGVKAIMAAHKPAITKHLHLKKGSR